MRKPLSTSFMVGAAALALTACGEEAQLPIEAGQGPNPQLPPPNATMLPTVNVASVSAWETNEKPTAAAGLEVIEFAKDLDHPRWMHILPNGDVLVAESSEPPEGEGVDDGIVKQARGMVQGYLMGQAGAKAPSANRVTLLRDGDGDGRVDTRSVFVENLFSPFGMALVGNTFYVANADAIVSFPYEPGQTRIDAPPTKVMDLPGGPRNHHWTKGLIASPDGTKLYAAVGSNSNVGENGMDEEEGRAAIWEVDVATGQGRVFASGLRNPVGMSWNPTTGELWTSVNERDEIGSDLVPDYMTSVKDGGFYGWPYSYYGQTVDDRIQPPRPDLVQKAIKPDYALGSHTASLGLTFAAGNRLPPAFATGAFVGQHGSWNRSPPSGYKVVFVPFTDGRPSGPVTDVLTGFLDSEGNAQGRPVGVTIDSQGALLVADDVGNRIWRVTGESVRQAAN